MLGKDNSLCITKQCPLRYGCVRGYAFEKVLDDQPCLVTRFSIPEGQDRCAAFLPIVVMAGEETKMGTSEEIPSHDGFGADGKIPLVEP